MIKSFIANIPSRKQVWRGKAETVPAYTMTFVQDDDGRWSEAERGAMTEMDVIDCCKGASNWAEIRAAHFPMCGFHA